VRAYLTGGEDPEEEEDQTGPAGGKGRAGVPPSRWEQDGLEVLYFSEMDHATVLDTPRDRAPLLKALRRFVRLDEDGDEDDDDDEGTKSTNVAGAAGAAAMLNGNLVDVE
jgi:hypothetical protein